jgi:chromosome segregation ATPase
LELQVRELSSTLDGLRNINRTLEENLSWSRSERDRLENALRQSQTELETAKRDRNDAQSDYEYWKRTADERESIIATLKADNDTIAFKNLELEEENAKLKQQVDAISAVLMPNAQPQAQVVKEPEPVKAPEPFLHPVTGVLQGRDPETKQFVPIKEPEADKPWWMDDDKKDASGSGF